jgi:cobalt-zinc-cadmium efflux system membrane fusion protein
LTHHHLRNAGVLVLLLALAPHAVPAAEGLAPGEVQLTGSQVKLIELATAPAKPGTVSPELTLNGEVAADGNRVVDVLPRVAGIVRQVPRQLGDTVYADDTLVVVESASIADAEANYLTARSKAGLAAALAAREAGLRRKGITSEQENQVARQAADQAAVELRAAERKLVLLGVDSASVGHGAAPGPNLLAIRAPFAGTLIDRHVTVGDQVAETTPMFRLANLDRVWVIASVFARDVGKVGIGQPASVVLEGYGDRRFEGAVTWISDIVDDKTRTVKLRIELDNADRTLRPGSYARVTITPRTGTVLTVPASAVQRQGDQSFVFVAGDAGLFRKRDVTLGARTRESVEVIKGLQAGETVVTSGAFALRSELEKSAFAGGD